MRLSKFLLSSKISSLVVRISELFECYTNSSISTLSLYNNIGSKIPSSRTFPDFQGKKSYSVVLNRTSVRSKNADVWFSKSTLDLATFDLELGWNGMQLYTLSSWTYLNKSKVNNVVKLSIVKRFGTGFGTNIGDFDLDNYSIWSSFICPR